jgi:hypothetical protein
MATMGRLVYRELFLLILLAALPRRETKIQVLVCLLHRENRK